MCHVFAQIKRTFVTEPFNCCARHIPVYMIMSQVRCVFRAHYKHGNISFYELGQFEQWLSVDEAIRLQNDRAARVRLFRMHFPSATVIDRDEVTIELHERR